MVAHSSWWWWDKQVEGLENSDVSFRMLESSALGSQGKVALERAYWIRAPAGSTENIPFWGHIGNDRSGFFGPAIQPGFGQLTFSKVSNGRKPFVSMRKSPLT